MFFSIGGHPGFNIPVGERIAKRGPYLVFNKKETAKIFSRKGKLLDGNVLAYLENQSKIPINGELFKDGARVFSDLKSNQISIHDGKKRMLSLVFDDFPYLAIWPRSSNPGFVCLEPWYGIPDFVTTDQNIEKKKGIIALKSQKNLAVNTALRFDELFSTKPCENF